MFGWFRSKKNGAAAARLYGTIIDQARDPVFYRDMGVADSLDGRFDMLSLHAMLVMRRLKGEAEQTAALSQALFDHMFADMDATLREIGVGDLSVGKKVKQMGEAFLGRVEAYESALNAEDGDLAGALSRNVYRDTVPAPEHLSRLADYTRRMDAHLAGIPVTALLAGGKELADCKP